MVDMIWVAFAALVGLGGTWLLGYVFIPFLHKLKFGQPIKEIGPTWHEKKRGTPTMGGLMFIISSVAAIVLVMLFTKGAPDSYGYSALATGANTKLICGVIMALLYAFCGFIDDYAKVKKQLNTGLTGWQKLFLQVLIAVAFLLTLRLAGVGNTLLWIPFVGYSELGLWYYPLMVIFIVGTINAVNINDGIDGLCSSLTLVASIAFGVISAVLKTFGATVLAAAAAGGCAGFLIHNHKPAKIFMGDLGSHYLGGLLVALAFYLDKPILLIPIGLVYYLEMLSVVLQVISFKLTGKRIFKMSPIHHHFEMCGWSENKICVVFSVVGIIGGAVGCLLALRG